MFFGLLFLISQEKFDEEGKDIYFSFFEGFNFSVQTSETIGYGSLSPHKIASNIIVDIEALISFISKTIISALFVAKLMMPTRLKNFIKHTKKCIINDKNTVMYEHLKSRAMTPKKNSQELAPSNNIEEFSIHQNKIKD
mmetsp:Transcript_63862/g.54171  ORF Transcript_63862/g.54171 Transcript_63862/m.54171 type:complete len:139 (+) Transcript_63862:21-437(+)